MMKHLCIILFLCFHPCTCPAQGLSFNGNNRLIEERTSYNVFANGAPHFRNTFSIRFELSIHELDGFGNIFRLKDGANRTYCLVYKPENRGRSSFMFNKEGRDNLVSAYVPRSTLGDYNWLPVSVQFLMKENAIVIEVGDVAYRADNVDLSGGMRPQIYFGKNEHVIDVPEFAIKELTVGGDGRRYVFPLLESEGGDVHDRTGRIVGRVSNPVWLINDSFHWKLRYSYVSETVSGVCYDQSAQNFVLFNRDSLVILDMRSGAAEIRKFAGRLPVDIRLGTCFIDAENGRLYAYEVNNLPEGAVTIAYVDYRHGNRWEGRGTQRLDMQLHHHNGFFDPRHERYIVFGGFGNQRYNKEFLSLDLARDRWDTLPIGGDAISPRYFSGMASCGGKLYIFGGMGNELGDQTIGRRYFYDLYRVDLNTLRAEKLWNIPWDRENMVSTRNMVMTGDSSFYTLCYPEHLHSSYLRLYRFSVADGSHEVLGDEIPIVSEKIGTNANLYYNPVREEFYCTVQQFGKDETASQTHIYSLASPPVGLAGLSVYNNADQRTKADRSWLWLLAAPAGLLAWAAYKRKKQKDIRALDAIPPVPEEKTVPNDRPNSIYVFGDFTVYDRKGKDITYRFSSRLRQSFLLMLQHCADGGIPVQELSGALWPGKSPDNAKNLRNVTVNHLRKALEDLDGLELIFESGKLKLMFSDECYCDYTAFTQALISGNGVLRTESVTGILSRGRFLKSADKTMLKDFIDRTEGRIVSLLPIDMENAYNQRNYTLAIRLAELLFITDPLNRDALYYQINSLYRLRQADNAKIRYNLFAARYREKYNLDFPDSFASLIKDRL